MFNPVLRDVHTLLSASGTGLSSVLPTVPRPIGDGTPTAPTLFSALDTPWAARDTLPQEQGVTTPVLVLSIARAVTMPARPERMKPQAPTVSVLCRYLRRNVAQTAHAMRAGYHVLRATQRVIAQAYDAPQAERAVDGVFLEAPTFTLIPALPEPTDGTVLCALEATFPVHDPWALAATP